MKIIIIISLLVLLIIPLVSAQDNILIWRDKNVSGYVLLFLNLNTSKGYKAIVNDKGKFDFSQNDITHNASLNELVKVNVCINVISSSSNKDIVYCNGTGGYFYTLEHGNRLTIDVNSRVINWQKDLAGLTDTCSDENLYFCSVILGNGTNIFYNSYFKTDYFESSIDTYTFKDIRFDTLPSSGVYSLSSFASDGANSILHIDQFYVSYTDVTNPYPEKREAIIKTNEPTCLLENGQTEIRTPLDPKETKRVPVFSPPSVSCNKIEINLVKIEGKISDISLGKVEINIFSVTIAIVGISVLVVIVRKFVKRK